MTLSLNEALHKYTQHKQDSIKMKIYNKWYYAECHFAYCYYAESRGATVAVKSNFNCFDKTVFLKNFFLKFWSQWQCSQPFIFFVTYKWVQ